MKDNNIKKAEAAEFPPDTELAMGADYDENPSFEVLNGSRDFHYFLASKAEDGSSQTVSRCKAVGYQVCTTEKMAHDPQDRVLMRIPAKVFNARRAAKRKRRLAAREQSRKQLQGVPAANTMRLGEAGHRPGADDDWVDED